MTDAVNGREAPDPGAGARTRARLAAFAWGALGLGGASAGFVTLGAAASLVAQAYGPAIAGFVVAAITGTLAFVIPLLLGNGIVKLVHARGYQPARRPIYATAVALVNVIYVALLHFTGPQEVPRLWLERGTWVFDAMTSQGPYGPPAVPVVTRTLAELGASYTLRDTEPRWCDESAAAFAVGLAAGLAKDGPAPLAATLATVTQRYGAALEGQPAPGTDGRAMLSAVTDVVLASFPDLTLAPVPSAEASVAAIARREITLATPGWTARYERGAWRWCPGTAEELRARGEQHAANLREEVRRVPTPNAIAAGPWDADVRSALHRAVLGRSAWLAGAASTLDRSWADALTRAAAAEQGERLRAWCTRGSASDDERSAAIEAFAEQWNLPKAGQRIKGSARGLLEAQGRQYLAELVDLCKPAVAARQAREDSSGLRIPEAQRAGWAEGEARAFASDAHLAADGDAVKIELDGRELRAVQEDGRWRIDWQD